MLENSDGDRPRLRFVRRLAHPPEKVFAAVSEPEALRARYVARLDGGTSGESRPATGQRIR